jgi:hypothetical protein
MPQSITPEVKGRAAVRFVGQQLANGQLATHPFRSWVFHQTAPPPADTSVRCVRVPRRMIPPTECAEIDNRERPS